MQLSATNLRRVLIGSLIVNVFLIAYVAAAWIAIAGGASPYFATILPGAGSKAERRRFDPRAALAAVAQPHRQKADQILRRKRKELKSGLRETRALRRQLRTILMAEKLDQPALGATLTSLRRRGSENREVFHELLLKLTKALPDDQRRRYFQHGIPRIRPGAPKKRP